MKIKPILIGLPGESIFATELLVQIHPFSTCCKLLKTYNQLKDGEGNQLFENNKVITLDEYNEITDGNNEEFTNISLSIIEDIILTKLGLERL